MTAQHPALACLICGSPSEAIAHLTERGDCPAALALLKAGMLRDAESVLRQWAKEQGV